MYLVSVGFNTDVGIGSMVVYAEHDFVSIVMSNFAPGSCHC